MVCSGDGEGGQAMTSPATIDRVAKAIFARRQGDVGDLFWSNIDESERTQYRLDAVAAIAAYTAGDEA